jgi:hypothetical protein
MTMVDVNSIQDPLDLDKFRLLSDDKYPYSIIGFQLKNSYDQQRIKVKSKYNTKDIIHLLPKAKVTPTFFRGIKIHIREKYLPLIEQFKKLNVIFNESISIDTYKNLLGEYGLSCNECYAFLKKGIYPIDGSCLANISNIDITLESLYENAFDTKTVPAFQSFSSFTIFILCNESLFPTSIKT